MNVPTTDLLLSVRDLKVTYALPKGSLNAVDGASFDVPKGSIVGLVGESGCGKSTAARALTRVIADNAKITGGQAIFGGQDLVGLTDRQMNALRWRDISLVPQSAMNSLDPVCTVEAQLNEVLRKRGGMGRRDARMRSEELFEMVGIERGRLADYPHQFSGGMRQRVAIALALALNPRLVIADEPVTALDVIVQRQILDTLRDLQRELGISILMVTHDISVVAYICDRTVVMYAGQVVEEGAVADVLDRPGHPYAMGLRNAFPDLASAGSGVLTPIRGAPPNLAAPPPGCRFAPRCPFAESRCVDELPGPAAIAPGHIARCHRSGEAQALRHTAGTPETWMAEA
ncbi:ABC transporter ATP-binding protein [Frigidibacter mobilis]|uniref:Oligopeptide/dipeptide ABC transporter, ATPase subunit n=1 Tax=Frigidibacter mobilis TaxID=1335048 RepID=A0A159Z1Q3_9RHOB|nr:ABC transporter ATP-binding protein [Frigidibacter mobilis]AMY68871.1 oligopeptide/dipeptide ABC transporter, ATPase subunit [Frigidibacter mobilis]